jgi:hypothetical protein
MILEVRAAGRFRRIFGLQRALATSRAIPSANVASGVRRLVTAYASDAKSKK